MKQAATLLLFMLLSIGRVVAQDVSLHATKKPVTRTTAVQQAEPSSPPTNHTTFQGFWVGMSVDEFRATPKGAEIANTARYPQGDVSAEDDCEVKDKYGLRGPGALCETWDHMNDTRKVNGLYLGGTFTLADPNPIWVIRQGKRPDGPVTIFDFSDHKLLQISYRTNEEGEDGFNKVVGQLAAKYGRPTRAGTNRNTNGFGAVWYSHYAQWARPDGTCIGIEARFELGNVAIVHYFIPEKPKTATTNPY